MPVSDVDDDATGHHVSRDTSIIHYQSNKLLPTLTLALKMHKQDHNSLRVDHKWGFIFSITWECVDGPLRRCIKSWQMHNKANVQCTCIETVSALLWVLFLLPSSLQYPGQSAPNCQCMMAAIQTSRVSYRDHISVSPALHLFLCHKIDADTIFIQTWTSIRQNAGARLVWHNKLNHSWHKHRLLQLQIRS